ncbi:MAG: aromatic ring-hydroxylating dioxygenase subunit alpha [Ilumatobacteraceae bacterium]
MTNDEGRQPAPLDPAALAATMQPFGWARTLPRAAYVDEAVLTWEREHIFDGGWICVGRTDVLGGSDGSDGDIGGPAQTAIEVGATSVLVTRDAAGELRAFANICRHRGHELLPCGGTSSRGVVQCPYHAWSYELDGRLRLAPHVGQMPNLVPDELGLLPVALASWQGWLFVNVDGTAPPFAEHLGGLAELVAPWAPARLRVAATHHYDLAANWKAPIENYHECYHCPLIHPELCRVSPADSGVNIDDVPGAFVGGASRLAPHADTMSFDGRSPVGPFPGLDAEQLRQIVYVQLFPNLLLSLHPDYVMSHRIEALTATTSRIECQWLFDPTAMAAPGFDPTYAVEFWDLTNRQDWAAVESVQRGLGSPRFVPGIFAANEDAVYHFVSMMAAAYAGSAVQRPVIGSVRPGRQR